MSTGKKDPADLIVDNMTVIRDLIKNFLGDDYNKVISHYKGMILEYCTINNMKCFEATMELVESHPNDHDKRALLAACVDIAEQIDLQKIQIKNHDNQSTTTN